MGEGVILASWKVLILLDIMSYLLNQKNVKVNNNNKNRKGASPLICKLHIQWGLFHIIKVIVVKYNTAEISESLVFFYHNAVYLLKGIHLCIKRQTGSNYHLTMYYYPGIHLKVL